MPAEWTDAELEQLSAYIDGQLDDSDRTALEARLAQDADLRQELAAMRQTVALLRDLPTIRAPRAFTLTPEMVGQTAVPVLTVLPAASPQAKTRPRPVRRVWWIPAASAAGVVLLAGVFALTQMSSSPAPATSFGGGVAQVSTMQPMMTATSGDFSALNTVVDNLTVSTSQPVPLPPQPTLLTEVTGGFAAQPPAMTADITVGGAVAPEALPGVSSAASASDTGATTPADNSEELDRTAARETTDDRYQPETTNNEPTTVLDLASGGGSYEAPVGAVAGMEVVNPDPAMPGFTAATMSPPQGTQVALYSIDQQSGDAAGVTLAESAPPNAEMAAKQEPIWERWLNTLAGWLQAIFRR